MAIPNLLVNRIALLPNRNPEYEDIFFEGFFINAAIIITATATPAAAIRKTARISS